MYFKPLLYDLLILIFVPENLYSIHFWTVMIQEFCHWVAATIWAVVTNTSLNTDSRWKAIISFLFIYFDNLSSVVLRFVEVDKNISFLVKKKKKEKARKEKTL